MPGPRVPCAAVAAVFVLPQTAEGQLGPVAAYVSTSGWAEAATRVLGQAWIACPDGILEPLEVRRRATAGAIGAPAVARYRHLPEVVKTLAKDVRQQRRARAFTVDDDGPWRGHRVDFVWQRHELFQTAGLDLARRLGQPSVLFVPATKVWEAERWGTRRPGWGRLVEQLGESPALSRADLVACGSEEVAEQAVRLGTSPDRVVITPTGVDLEVFGGSRQDRDALRARLGLTDRFVVGWMGSFRPFHALERAVDAMEGLADATLLLVGDGPERPAIEARARDRGVTVVSTGTVAHADLPDHLSAMDVGLVLGPPGIGFHYSPLKLAEYLASGLAVVAPRVTSLTSRLRDGVDCLFFDPDDGRDLHDRLTQLQADPARRRALGARARVRAAAEWSWDAQVQRVLDALTDRAAGLAPPASPRRRSPAPGPSAGH